MPRQFITLLHIQATHLVPPHPLTTLCHLGRGVRSRLLSDWQRDWAASPPQGGFAPADRIKPSLKPATLLSTTSRKIFSRITQARTGHAHIGGYYRWRVPSEIPSCPCGEVLQTRQHILQSCPLYSSHRHILRKISPTISLPVILGTEQGIKALARFIEKSDAFSKITPRT